MSSSRSVRTAADWARLRDAETSSKSNGLRLRAVRRAAPTDPARLGVAIRATGRARAVARNRTKRRLRAAFAAVGPESGWDVAVWADPSATSLSYQELEGHLVAALKRAGAR